MGTARPQLGEVVIKKDEGYRVRKYYLDFAAVSDKTFASREEAQAALDSGFVWYELE